MVMENYVTTAQGSAQAGSLEAYTCAHTPFLTNSFEFYHINRVTVDNDAGGPTNRILINLFHKRGDPLVYYLAYYGNPHGIFNDPIDFTIDGTIFPVMPNINGYTYTIPNQPACVDWSIMCVTKHIVVPPSPNSCQCAPGWIGPGCSINVVCGDGRTHVGYEACDDGNLASGDGCSSTCELENVLTFDCATPSAVPPNDLVVKGTTVCTLRCGNGIIDASAGEVCDDGNSNDFDGCSNICRIENGFYCHTKPNNILVPTPPPPPPVRRAMHILVGPVCGNGAIEPPEQCDEGAWSFTSHGCPSCQIVPGYSCVQTALGASRCCVDGAYYNSDFDRCIAIPIPVGCGNGVITPPEQCEPNGSGYTTGCTQYCTLMPGYACGPAQVGPGSVCSVVPFNAGNPQSVCTPNGCGDGVVLLPETCDDGNTEAMDGCSGTCQPEHGFVCQPLGGECHSVCGDGLVASNEGCDRGAGGGGGGCGARCQLEAEHSCRGEPSTCSHTARCGDGSINYLDGEECDDGNINDRDGCDGYCRLEGTSAEWICPLQGGVACRCNTNAVCSPGSCNAADGTCVCPPGLFGAGCGRTCTALDTCGGHGDCDGDGRCTCSPGHYGTNCETECTAATTCSGNGQCASTGQCVCNTGLVGRDCTVGCTGVDCPCTVCGTFDDGTPGNGTTAFDSLEALNSAGTCTGRTVIIECPPKFPAETPAFRPPPRACEFHLNGITIQPSPYATVPLVLNCTARITGSSVTLAGASFIPLGRACDRPQVDVDVTVEFRVQSPRDVATGQSSGKRIASFFDIFTELHAPRDPASGLPTGKRQHKPSLRDMFADATLDVTRCYFTDQQALAMHLRESPSKQSLGKTTRTIPATSFFDVFFDIDVLRITPDMQLCLMRSFFDVFTELPQFGDVHADGCSAIKATVASPVVIENAIYVNYPGFPPVVDITMNGPLTFRNNTFENVPGRAVNIVGALEMDVYDNRFQLTGGADTTVLYIRGSAVPSGQYRFHNNEITDYAPITHPLATAFWLDTMDFSVLPLYISSNRAPLVGPTLPLTGFQYGLVIQNFPDPGPLCGPATTPGQEDERCYAVANPQMQGMIDYVAREHGAPVDRTCNDLCPHNPFVPSVTTAADTVVQEILVTVVQSPSNVQAVDITITYETNVLGAMPYVDLMPFTDADSPRIHSTCASRNPAYPELSFPWPDVFDLNHAPSNNALWTVSPSPPSVPGRAAFVFTATFTIADLYTCHPYLQPGVDLMTMSNSVYTFDVCPGFVSPNNAADEVAGWTYNHRLCTHVQFTLMQQGSVLVSIVASAFQFNAHVINSEFLASGHLQYTFRTSISHLGSLHHDLRDAVITLVSGTMGNPSFWVVVNPPMPCLSVAENPDAATECWQVWTVQSTHPSLTTLPDFNGQHGFSFRIYNADTGVARDTPTLLTFTLDLDLLRTLSQDAISVIGLEASVFTDAALTIPYSPANPDQAFILGERAYVSVCASLPLASANDVAIDVELAVYCTPSYPAWIRPYDPYNPGTTGCSTLGAGIGTNAGVFYQTAGGNTGYADAAQFQSEQHAHPNGLSSCRVVSTLVDHWVSDHVATFLQLVVAMTTTLDSTVVPPPVLPNIPAPALPLHARKPARRTFRAVVSLPRTVAKRTPRKAARSTLPRAVVARAAAARVASAKHVVIPHVHNAPFSVVVSMDSATRNIRTARRPRTPASQKRGAKHAVTTVTKTGVYVQADNPNHITGIPLRVHCAKARPLFAHVVDIATNNTRMECIDPAGYSMAYDANTKTELWSKHESAVHTSFGKHPRAASMTPTERTTGQVILSVLFGCLVLAAIVSIAVIFYATSTKNKETVRTNTITQQEPTRSRMTRGYNKLSANDPDILYISTRKTRQQTPV